MQVLPNSLSENKWRLWLQETSQFKRMDSNIPEAKDGYARTGIVSGENVAASHLRYSDGMVIIGAKYKKKYSEDFYLGTMERKRVDEQKKNNELVINRALQESGNTSKTANWLY